MKLKDLIVQSLGKKKISSLSIDALLKKIVCDTYFTQTGRNIDSYIVSVHLKGSKLYITTGKPIVGEELLHYEDKISSNVLAKLNDIGKKYSKIDIYCK